MKKNFSPFPTLKTERLFLRKLSLNDVEEIYSLPRPLDLVGLLDRAIGL